MCNIMCMLYVILNQNNAPTEKAKSALPSELWCPTQALLDKTIVLFHDESTFQANEDKFTFWGTVTARIIVWLRVAQHL